MLDLDRIAREVVQSGTAPDVALGCAVREAGVWKMSLGGAQATLFDLASVTKPIFAVSFARSGVDRETRLGDVVAETQRTGTDNATLELLLAHRSGVAAHAPLWEMDPFDRSAALRLAATLRHSDTTAVYSDLGYLLAGEALTRKLASPLDEIIHGLTVQRLDLSNMLGSARMLRDIETRAAPTEGDIRGHVHDENAWAMSGLGTSGHAGLFGTIEGVVRFGTHVMDSMTELEWLIRERPGGTLRAGFDGKTLEGYSSTGTRMGPRTFGHLGFTGTSVWMDPDAGVCIAMLTNRVHPTRENALIREARPRVYDAIMALL